MNMKSRVHGSGYTLSLQSRRGADLSRVVCMLAGIAGVSLIASPHIAWGETVVKGQTSQRKIVATEVAAETVEVKVLAKTTVGTWVAVDDLTSDVEIAETEIPPTSSNTALTDCNNNGIEDAAEIASGAESDIDADGRLDFCEISFGDVNLDGFVNGSDLNIVLGWWNSGYSPTSDINHDGVVDGRDIAYVLAGWGSILP